MNVDPQTVGAVLGVLVTLGLGLLTWSANRNKEKHDGRFVEIDRLREDLNDRDEAYRQLVKEVHILNAWIFLLVKQIRSKGDEPVDRPDKFKT